MAQRKTHPITLLGFYNVVTVQQKNFMVKGGRSLAKCHPYIYHTP